MWARRSILVGLWHDCGRVKRLGVCDVGTPCVAVGIVESEDDGSKAGEMMLRVEGEGGWGSEWVY